MALEDMFIIGTSSWTRQEVTSTQTPDFVRKRAEGTLPVNDFEWDLQEGSNPLADTIYGPRQYSPSQNGFYHALRGGSMVGVKGDYVSVPSVQTLHDLAALRLRTKVSQATLEGGLNLAEFGKTADFVSGAMVKTARALKAARRGNVKEVWNSLTGGKPLLDAASDGWLAFTYAFKPLASDVEKSVRLLEEGLYLSPYEWVRTSRTRKVAASSSSSSESSRKNKSLLGDIRYGGGIQYRIDQPVIATLSALGLTDPLTIAWELVPFSFVVDWFVPVNEYLMQVGPPKGISFVKGYTTVKAMGRCSWEHWARTFPDPPGYHLTCRTQEILKSRHALHTFPTPGVVLPKLSLSKSNLVSGMALLQQALR